MGAAAPAGWGRRQIIIIILFRSVFVRIVTLLTVITRPVVVRLRLIAVGWEVVRIIITVHSLLSAVLFGCLHHCQEAVEQILVVLRAGRAFWVILHREGR